ncbi:uracil-DNA glycosylase family protein [Methylovirgula sp. 4M-Z18]|uniref:uracil-DNA glycosylase family protein n=1 Tax=Methylovirgula sp. 4M-Z18 TaxID=2293567 RepID=UPI000E2E5399|nr:uracil-DNA glycosylase family protein [Methylovirgula sp. 4M-Z18]RFB80445.1 uracil-DNA glycosylase family protein [Methylovirgula sp. 4M-Z18]
MRKSSELTALEAEIGRCRVCVEHPAGRPLPHEPRPVVRLSATARIVLAGQAPGTRVHASGMPYTDPSGDRLRAWMGVSAEEFYDVSRIAIVPMGFCFPGLDAKGGDLPPRRECRRTWHDRTFALMPQVRLVVAIGLYAQDYHLPRLGWADWKTKSLTETVAAFAAFQDAPVPVIPLPHPSWRNNAWIKKNPWFERDLLPVLRSEVRALL